MQATLRVRKVIANNDVVGTYKTEWGSHSDLVATQDVILIEWPGMILRERLDVQTPAVDTPVASGTAAGKLHVVLGDQQVDVALITTGTLDPPGMVWRLLRINLP
jgi:hypothetical protein